MKGGEKVNAMMDMMSISQSQGSTKLRSNNSSITNNSNQREEFVSSLEGRLNTKSKNKYKNNVTKEVETNREKLDSLEELLTKDSKELGEDDLKELLNILAGLSEQLKDILLKASGSKQEEQPASIDQLVKKLGGESATKNLDQGKQELLKILSSMESIKDKLLEATAVKAEGKKLSSSQVKAINQLKGLMDQAKASLVRDTSGEQVKDQKMLHQRAVNQANIAKLSRENQNKVERKIGFQGDEKMKLAPESKEEILLETIKDGVEPKVEKLTKSDSLTATKDFITADVKTAMAADKIDQSTTTTKEISFRDIVKQLTDNVDVLRSSKGKELTIELKPETLGRLHIKIGIEEGSVTAKILAENGQVKDLLEGNLAKLRDTLAQKDIQVENFDVTTGYAEDNFEEESANGQFNFANQNQNSNKFSLDPEELEDLVETEELQPITKTEEDLSVDENVDYVI